MWRFWQFACIAFAVAVAAAVVSWSVYDRSVVLAGVEGSTSSVSRLIAAHGDAAIAEARQVVSSIFPMVDAWDGEDPEEARAIHEQLQMLAGASSRIQSVWVTDAEGISVLSSWNFPADAIPSASRVYFQRHQAGEESPVITGSEEGSISGRQRFTYSHAIPSEDGKLHALIVVGVLTDALATLYDELEASSLAISGLYKIRGDVLAESEAARQVGLSEIAKGFTTVTASQGVRSADLGSDHVVAWQASTEFPGVVALSAQDVSVALGSWRYRTVLIASFGALMIGLTCVLLRVFASVLEERERVEKMDFAAREVSHRMKNSLQMIASFIRMRSRRCGHPETVEELKLIDGQLLALANVQELLEVGNSPGMVDVSAVLRKLCERLETTHQTRIATKIEGPVSVDSARAGRIAILANELVVNGLKHGDGRVRVETIASATEFRILIANGGQPLPADFDPNAQDGFGLKAAMAISEAIGATVRVRGNGPLGGAVFEIAIPLAARDETGASAA